MSVGGRLARPITRDRLGLGCVVIGSGLGCHRVRVRVASFFILRANKQTLYGCVSKTERLMRADLLFPLTLCGSNLGFAVLVDGLRCGCVQCVAAALLMVRL
jgi:hypothetical protein